MTSQNLRKFFISIVLPSFLAIVLFIVSIYFLIIPTFERNIMDRKKEMIKELTNTAWSLVDEYYQEYSDSILSDKEAKLLAASRVEKMRYGGEAKDYFWISDMKPVMVMHPYRQDLIDSDLKHYADPNGKKLFVEAVQVVKNESEGFINYYWQWKDDSSRTVPKLTYVRGFEPWGWVIGTGIYLEDVRHEIASLQSRLLKVSFVIALFIILIILYVIRQSLKIERKRKRAEDQLLLSNQKYKSLVDASTEGTLMLIDNRIIFANQKLANLIGFETAEILNQRVDDFFVINLDDSVQKITQDNKSFNIETTVSQGNKTGDEVVLSISKVDYNQHVAIIVVVKEVSTKKQIEKDTEQLSHELQTSLLLMNQPISHFVEPMLKCDLNDSIASVAILMTRKGQDIIFISNNNQLLGVVNDHDLRVRVLAESLDVEKPVSAIMSSPILSIKEDALLYEAILKFSHMGVSHLAVKNNTGTFIGKISVEKIMSVQRNSLSFLIQEIEAAENVKTLIGIVKKLPILVKALLDSGALIQNITRIVSSITDAVTKRIIQLSIEELGPPPCNFAFIVLGSEARMEQSLATDQDNAIIIEDTELDVRPYFMELAQKVNPALHETGYKLCIGDIMARNPKWNQPLETWKKYFNKWIHTPDPQSILETSIFFDFRCVFGDTNLVDELREFVFAAARNRDLFFLHLAQSVAKLKVPLGRFGQIKAREDNEEHQHLELKKILLPIIGFIRVYALRSQLHSTNSHQRLKELYEKGVFEKELFDEQSQSYNYLMMMRFRSQANQLLNNEAPNNNIDTKNLSEIEKTMLRKILSGVNGIQAKLNLDFKGIG